MAIKLTPLVGAHDSTGLLSYLLEIDEGRILLDCGCPDRPVLGEIDPYLNKLAELAPTLDLVLLSHPLLSSLGLVPLLRSRLGLRCPVYATLPTKEMGRWAAEEWIAQRALEESNGLENSTGLDNLSQSQNPNLSATDQSLQNAPAETETSPKSNTLNPPSKSNSSDQIWKVSFKELRDAFDSVIAVRYSQPIHLGGQSR
jgi:cleavage and polyadenylation specificity factor subunit 2